MFMVTSGTVQYDDSHHFQINSRLQDTALLSSILIKPILKFMVWQHK